MLRRRPLLRAAATTAVVAGTATAVSGRVARRQEARYAPAEPEPAPVADAPVESGGLGSDDIEELKQLAGLKDQGVLTEEEFAAAKAKILGS